MSAAWCAPAPSQNGIDAPLAIVDKRRERAGELGSHEHYRRHCRQPASCSTISSIRAALCATPPTPCCEGGAARVSAYITHGVLSGGAVARVAASKLSELVLTDTIQADRSGAGRRNIRVISIAPLIGEAIGRIAKEESVSSLFD